MQGNRMSLWGQTGYASFGAISHSSTKHRVLVFNYRVVMVLSLILFARLCLCPVKGTKRLLRDIDMCVDPIAHRIAVCIVTVIDADRELLWTIIERKGKPVGQLHIKEINWK